MVLPELWRTAPQAMQRRHKRTVQKKPEVFRISEYPEDCLKEIKERFRGLSHRFLDEMLLKVHTPLVL
jgi:hypothetical protein